MKSLRVKMTIMIVFLVLVSSGILSLISYERAKSSMSAQLEQNYSVAAEKYAQELTAWINTNATIIDTMATDIEVSRMFENDNATFHAYLKENYDRLNTRGYIYDFYFTYPDNTMACASDFVSDGSVDYSHDRIWYTYAAGTGSLYYSSPYMDSDTGVPIITISKAVYGDNEVKGVLAADIFVDTLVDIISEADVANDSYAFLVDRDMGMIVHPNDAYDFSDEPKGIMDVPGAPYEKVVENIRNDSNETVYVKDYDGVTRGIAVAKMENTGWYVGIATNKDIILKDVSGLMRGFLIAAVIAMAIGGISAVFLTQVMEKMSRQQQEYEAQVLRLEKQAADEASKAKSRFLADMSHEIRTPINAILGMNEMVIRETRNSDILEYSKNIKQSGHNLLQLINSILDFSKIEDGKMDIVPVRYKVGPQLAYIVSIISERARGKSIDLEVDIDPGLPSELYGDDMRIGEVMVNLLTNAVKYTEKGTVKFTVKELEREDGNVHLYVEVKDTGIGIREEDMERLFESFERLDSERNRNIEGTGLGIPITTNLLALMGSELKVQSVYGEGSVFSFELWQKIENEKPLGDYRTALSRDDEPVTYRETFHAPEGRILVVDDTEINVRVVVSLLKSTGLSIDTALSGNEAIALAEKYSYDVILMDQRMPGMDGTETMKRIKEKKDGKNSKTPVICLTADVVKGAKETYMAEGFDDYLSKPVDGIELEKLLIKYLPEEKVTMAMEEVSDNGKLSDPELYSALQRAGINTSSGLFFCQGDEEMYKDILKEFALEETTKTAHLKSCFDSRNWKDYGIYIHSLKSTSKTIGATELSAIAAELEAAAGKGDRDFIEKEHKTAMVMYDNVVSVIKKEMDVSGNIIQDDDEVFEFLPEGEDEEN